MATLYAPKTAEVSARDKDHSALVRELAGECMTLLENDGTLPLAGAGKVAVYGNGVRHTVKGGTGSGDVNTRTVGTIELGLKEAGFDILTGKWLDEYDKVLADAQAAYQAELAKKAEELHIPIFAVMFSEAFAQPDVPAITEKEDTDTAIYVLSRNSGEGADRYNRACDYLLGENELADIAYLAEHYEKTVLNLNIANLVDTTELKKIKGLNAILLAGQAGNATGNIVADVVLGKSIPSGKLTDTWAASYEDYPSSKNFSHNNGDTNDEYYSDGIYVGYRYFDTFNVTPNYCFGYGKGYTDFETEVRDVEADDKNVTVTASVKNIGDTFAGKEVVQVYYSAPDGTIEKPYQELGGFGKSDLLSPGESQTITISFPTRSMASYDEKKAAWVLEAGTYYIRVGNSSRTTKVAAALNLKETVVTVQGKNLFPADDAPQELSKAGVTPYSYEGEAEEKAAAKQIEICSKCIKTETVIYSGTPEAFPVYEGEKLTAADVKSGKATLKDLVSQLTVEEMATVCNGAADGLGQEGFIGSSSDMAPGAAGDTTSILLADRGIYNTILADGPAGLRLIPHFVVDADGKMVSSGNPLEDAFNKNEIEVPEGGTEYFQYCTAIPVAALLAQSWNMDLIQKCGDIVGKEMEEFHISVWLAPGMNIHRNPLSGRNFEYYSEDPLVSTEMAAALIKGVQSKNVGTSAKHFVANNQEKRRMTNSSDMDERTLREIYLASFEGAVKDAKPWTVMSSYNRINGEFVGDSKEYLTEILREEWGFDGYVVSDWGAVNDRVSSLAAGLDLEMPPGDYENDRLIVKAVQEGKLDESVVDQACERVLDVIFRYAENRDTDAVFDYEKDHVAAAEIEAECMV